MQKVTTTELKNILDSHALWLLTNGAEGERANLLDLEVDDAKLTGANLTGAGTPTPRVRQSAPSAVASTILEKKQTTVSSESDLRAKFDELAKSLGLKIVSLKVEKTTVETIDL